jgi:hypothetical protein
MRHQGAAESPGVLRTFPGPEWFGLTGPQYPNSYELLRSIPLTLRSVTSIFFKEMGTRWHLIQILLPLTDNSGKPLPGKLFQEIKEELTARFKGLTVYSRAPAEGLWKPSQGTKRDEIIVYEVMTCRMQRAWWRDFRVRLERLFRQESVVIRAHTLTLL